MRATVDPCAVAAAEQSAHRALAPTRSAKLRQMLDGERLEFWTQVAG